MPILVGLICGIFGGVPATFALNYAIARDWPLGRAILLYFGVALPLSTVALIVLNTWAHIW